MMLWLRRSRYRSLLGLLVAALFSCSSSIDSEDSGSRGDERSADASVGDAGSELLDCDACPGETPHCEGEVWVGPVEVPAARCGYQDATSMTCEYSEEALALQREDCAAVQMRCYPEGCALPAWDRSEDWLAYYNGIRQSVGLSTVLEDQAVGEHIVLHAKYLIDNEKTGHDEDPSDPGYTAEGAQAGQRSSLAYSFQKRDYTWAIDNWMTAPLHGLSLLHPFTTTAAYGEYYDMDAGWITFAAGLSSSPSGSDWSVEPDYPIAWPPNGHVTHLSAFKSESPDPLELCEGYTAPSGLPIYVQFGGDTPIEIATGKVFVNGVQQEVCVLFERMSQTGAVADHFRGRLEGRGHAVILMPKTPFPANAEIEYEITTPGHEFAASFRTDFVVREDF